MTKPHEETPPVEPATRSGQAERLQQERQRIVATLSEENARLLLARQRVSGMEIEVLAAQQAFAAKGASKENRAALADLRDREAVARNELANAEQRIEDLENHMTAILSDLAALND